MKETEENGNRVYTLELPNGASMEFRPIPAGSFPMGSRGYNRDEEPIHQVQITQPYWMATYPVTQAQFRAWTESEAYRRWSETAITRGRLKETHKNYFDGKDDHPAENVTWYEAAAYCFWLRRCCEASGIPLALTPRLPTEAQWEWACRGDSEGRFSEGEYPSGDGVAALQEIAWYDENSEGSTHRVGERGVPNGFGLRDLCGQVWEWCRDAGVSDHYAWRADAVRDPMVATRDGVPAKDIPEIAEWTSRVAWLELALSGESSAEARTHPGLESLHQRADFLARRPNPVGWDLLRDALETYLETGLVETDSRARLEKVLNIGRDVVGDPNERLRVIRGGSWFDPAAYCRSSFRDGDRPGVRNFRLGFRVCLAPGPVSIKERQPAPWPAETGDRAALSGGTEVGGGYGPRGGASAAARRFALDRRLTLRVSGDQWALHDANGTSKEMGPLEPGLGLDWDRIREEVLRLEGILVKVVIGRSPGSEDSGDREAFGGLPNGFAETFAGVTHLYLWSLDPVREIPELPRALRVLEIRNCPNLVRLPELPRSLERLIIDNAPQLDRGGLPDLPSAPELVDLSLRGGAALPETWLQALLASAPNLRVLDLSGCENLASIGMAAWPKALRSAKFNECPRFDDLPDRWGRSLTRVELRGTAITSLPNLSTRLDYLDLEGTRDLEGRDKDWAQESRWPRTLVLYNSAICRPPAAEHGGHSGANVADATRGYFEDIARYGEVDVHRCKVLFLGNGEAGKTSLALRLTGEDPEKGKEEGTTHGVKLRPAQFGWRLPRRGRRPTIDLDCWDFGGQELYHNTHRQFMETGSVFLTLWKPSQDEYADTPEPDDGKPKYSDVWRRLSYWIDLIHLSCPTKPRIAVVSSHREEWSDPGARDRIRDRFKEELGDRAADVTLIFYDSFLGDSRAEDGGPENESEKLWTWLRNAVTETIESQGTGVPAPWKLGEGLVRQCLADPQKDSEAAAQRRTLEKDQFELLLEERVQEVVDSPEAESDEYETLARVWGADGGSEWKSDPKRLDRALDFLTHIGAILWDRSLLENRVVIDQAWALEGIYALLERREKTKVFEAIRNNRGRFDRDLLNQNGWRREDGPIPESEQDWLLGLMCKLDLCVKLDKRGAFRLSRAEYLSFVHLPKRTEFEFDWRKEFARRFAIKDATSESVQSERLHAAHKQNILSALARQFGADAVYAWDGFYLPTNEEGQTILIEFDLSPRGIGGEILIRVGGPGHRDTAEKLKKEIQNRVHLGTQRCRRGDKLEKPINDGGAPTKKRKVFVSYAWDPMDKEIPKGYEAPVDAIEQALAEYPGEVELLRDRTWMKQGDRIPDFIKRIQEADKVILIASDKYYRSWYCMYEYHLFRESCAELPNRSLDRNLIVVSHRSGAIEGENSVTNLQLYWGGIDPRNCPAQLTLGFEEKCKVLSGIKSTVEFGLERLAPQWIDRALRWTDESTEVVDKVKAFVLSDLETGSVSDIGGGD